MYTISKAPHGVLAKTRINGNKCISIETSLKSISPPNERNSADTVSRSPCPDRLPSGPNPVFFSSKKGASSYRRKPRPDKTPEQEVRRVKPDAEVVSFFAVSWNSLQSNPETEKKNSASKSNDVVYYRPQSTVKLPDFTPCNYERVWADHHYQKLIRHVDLSIKNQAP